MAKVLRIVTVLMSFTFLIAFGFTSAINQAQTVNYGSNWTAIFFNNTDLSGSPVLSQTGIAQVNFTYGTASPSPGFVNSDNFSIRFTTLQPFSTGTYRFTAQADDGVRVTIDGTTVINSLIRTDASRLYTADVSMTEGTREIRVEYADFSGNAVIQFYWEPISIVPTGTFGPTPTPTMTGLPPIPAGALTATVIRAGTLNTRDAPSLGGNVIRRILRGQTYQIVGRDPDARWFLLELGGLQAWAYGYYLFVNGNEFNAPIRSAATAFGIPAGFHDTGVLVQTCATMRLRAEPNLLSPQTGRITWGAFLPVAARTPAGDWYQVLWKGTIGWVYTGFTWLRQGDYVNIPVVQAGGASPNHNPYPPISECAD